jgi:hypothetical protein
MDQAFDAWVESVLPTVEPDEGGDVGHRPVGLMDFLREMFDKHGAVPLQALRQEGNGRQLSLTRTGADLLRADLERTTGLRPVIEVWWSEEIGTPAAAFNGGYTTPALFSMRAPEAICEVVDNLRDHVVDELSAVWPVCPDDGLGLDPRPVDGRAMWYCRVGKHAVAPIGQLPAASPNANG